MTTPFATVLAGAELGDPSRTPVVPLPGVVPLVTVARFLAQATPKMIAHRGLAQVAPENTLVAYRAAIAAMQAQGVVPAVKTDVWLLADGALGVMHDSTVDRTTTSSGSVANYSAQTWKTLTANTSLVGPAWASDGWGMTLLADLLLDFGGKAVLFIEPKNLTAGAVTAACNTITARGLQSSCVLVGEDTTLALPAIAQAYGIGWWYYWLANPITGPVTPAQAVAATGVTGLGVCVNQGNSFADADITTVVTTAHAAGLPVNGFTYIRRYDYTRGVSFGIDVHVANDLYVTTTAAARTSDAFSVGAPLPGEVGSALPSGSVYAPSPGYLGTAGNYRRSITPAMGLGGVYECLGFMCPKAGYTGSSVYTVGGTMFWDAAETSTATGAQWGAIEVGAPDDRVYVSNNGPAYTCAIRQGNGSSFAVPTLQVFKQIPGAYQNNGSYATGTGTQVGANKGSATGFAGPNTLGASFPAGTPVTSLTLGSAVTIPAGMKIAMPTGQIATVSGAVSASVTVPIASLTPSAAWSSGAAVSFGIPFTVKFDASVANQVTITFTRTDTNDQLVATDTNTGGVGPYTGGYVHIGKAGTGSAGSTLALSFAQLSMS